MSKTKIIQLLLKIIKLQQKQLKQSELQIQLIRNNWNKRYGKLEEKYERLQTSR